MKIIIIILVYNKNKNDKNTCTTNKHIYRYEGAVSIVTVTFKDIGY